MTSITLLTPLVPLAVAMSARGWDERATQAAIDDGTLEYAFNIACLKSARRYVRVFAPCLAGDFNKDGRFNELPAVIQAILPPGTTDPTVVSVARRFACDPCHIVHLVREGSLNFAHGENLGRRGSRSSPRLARQSLAHFLEARRLL